ncbi:MAG: DUF2512 family protein [Bacteroidota bacterium]
MGHLRHLLVKFLLYTIILGTLLPALGHAPLAEAVVSAAGLAFALYAGGDLFILPYFGPLWSAAADIGLAFLTLWGFVLLLPGLSLPPSRLVTPALAVGVAEYLFHLYLRGRSPLGGVHRPPGNPG